MLAGASAKGPPEAEGLRGERGFLVLQRGDELDFNLFYSERGHYTIAHSEASLRTQRWRAEVNQHLGIDSEIVGPAFIKEQVPEIDLSCGGKQPPIYGALYHPPGAIARHDAVAWAYARGADRRGTMLGRRIPRAHQAARWGRCSEAHVALGLRPTRRRAR